MHTAEVIQRKLVAFSTWTCYSSVYLPALLLPRFFIIPDICEPCHEHTKLVMHMYKVLIKWRYASNLEQMYLQLIDSLCRGVSLAMQDQQPN